MKRRGKVHPIFFILGTVVLFFGGPVIGFALHFWTLAQATEDVPESIVGLSSFVHFGLLSLSFILCFKALFVILVVHGGFSWIYRLITAWRRDASKRDAPEKTAEINTLIFLPLILIPTIAMFLCGGFFGVSAKESWRMIVIVYSLVGLLYGSGIYLLLHFWFRYGNPADIPM